MFDTRTYTVTAETFAVEYADLFGGTPAEFIDDFERIFETEEAELSEYEISELYDHDVISAGQHDALLFALEQAVGEAAWEVA
jgi:hypothetical protein